MMNSYDIILKPVVSEKSYNLADIGKYTFEVHPDAKKPEIKKAVQEAFDVKVKSVNVYNRLGKRMRNRYGFGKRSDFKRAIVTVADGESISVFGA
jgi:large subunit ribosomal protein L23